MPHNAMSSFSHNVTNMKFATKFLFWVETFQRQRRRCQNQKLCHEFNNEGIFHFDENEYRYLNKVSPSCKFSENCAHQLCQFKHPKGKVQEQSFEKCDSKNTNPDGIETHRKTEHAESWSKSEENDDSDCETWNYGGETFDNIDDLYDHYCETQHNLDEDQHW